MRRTILTVTCGLGLAAAPGHGQAAAAGAHVAMQGNGITVALQGAQGRFPGLRVTDTLAGRSIELPQAFVIAMHDGSVLRSSDLTMGPLEASSLPLHDTASQTPGQRVCADFRSPRFSGSLRWCLLMRNDAAYFRQTLTIAAENSDAAIAEVRMLDFDDPGAHVSGTVRGSPVVDADLFFGFEHPLSTSRVENGHVTASLARTLPLRAGQSETYSSVVGVAAAGQMRRAFLHYIEAERPRPYSPFLHYNSWYDLGYQNLYDEAGALDRVHAFGTELVEKRHVTMSSFLFDDGWDNRSSLWGFNSGFPNGFAQVAAAAARYNFGIGVWLSPWGGYEGKEQRLAYGRAHGYEIVNDGYALSGPRYFQAFEQVCMEMMDRYGVNQFKFDGTGNANRVFPGSAFDSDFDAAIHLIETIRRHKPGIFINLTTGTYPSPFWLFYADSIWRGGEDHDFDGVGSSRERWITYRDAQTWRHIVLGGPLFPLNSLMLHGLIYAQFAEGLKDDPGNDFPREVQSYFASGTQLEEMYITPSLLSTADWDALARAARWSRSNAAILDDTHWIGGDPDKLEVYGWAAWSPLGWIVTLRNPSDKAQTYTLDLEAALELPRGAAIDLRARDPFGPADAKPARFDRHHATIALGPFAVRTWEGDAPPGASR
jgi:hypothetical protein